MVRTNAPQVSEVFFGGDKMAISNEEQLELIALGLKTDHEVTELAAMLEHAEGRGHLRFTHEADESSSGVEYVDRYQGERLHEIGKGISSMCSPLRPKSVQFAIPRKDIEKCLDMALPSWIKDGYDFTYVILNMVEGIHGLYTTKEIVFYKPELISNADEIKEYCKRHGIEVRLKI